MCRLALGQRVVIVVALGFAPAIVGAYAAKGLAQHGNRIVGLLLVGEPKDQLG